MTSGQESYSEFNCKKCTQVDNDRMVQCDKCNRWYHFDCVAVNSGISDESWCCEGCNGPSVSSAISTANQANQPQAASSPKVGGKTQQQQENGPKENPCAGAPTASIQREINMPNGTTAATNYTKTAQSQQYVARPPMGTQTCTSSVPVSTMFFPLIEQKQPSDHATSQINLQLKMLEEQQRLQQEFIEKKYQILSQCEKNELMLNETCNRSPNWNFGGGPTPSQLAARQAIPKELPQFHGDPEEWPLFISSFETSTSIAGYSHAENLIRLQACLKGKAKELVKSKLMMPTMVPEIIQTLKMCFGRPEHILERLIEKARKMPPPKEKLEAIIEFALCVKNICSTMEACKMDAHLHNPILVKEFVDKLSSQYKLNWAMYPKADQTPIVKVFSDWIFQIADAASSVVSTTPCIKNATVNSHTENKPQLNNKCFVCESSNHKVSVCNEFKKLSLNDKWSAVKRFNLCRQCLNKHRRKCFTNNDCGIDGCRAKHHHLLHNHNKNIQTSRSNGVDGSTTSSSSSMNSHSVAKQNQISLFRILPVRIQKKNGYVDTFAFLDEGSSVTLIERELFDYLDIKGVEEPLCLKWTGDTTRIDESSIKASIKIANINNGSQFMLNGVHTIEGLDLPTQSLDMNDIVLKYPYLAGIPIKSYKDVKPTILIGADNWNVAVPLRIREGSWHQPIATKTRIGWTIQGVNDSPRQTNWLNIHNCNCERKYDELHQTIKNSFSLEESAEKALESIEDQESMKILKNTCQKVDGRYEVGLLWKSEVHQLPESYSNAYKRLMCLQKKFNKDENLKVVLQKQIDNLLQKGYAKKLSVEEINCTSEPVWYLPTFITINPNKPSKVRMVWDAAAKSNGVCLNDFIHRGPDLLKPLIDILMSFRVGKVAICGDIEEMFHRINVRERDMHSQRFIWWDKDDDPDQPSIYVMRALTFGICCAPCIAHYVRDQNAEHFKFKYPRAVEAIQQCHYVDDFIDSVDNCQQAIELASQVKLIHSAGGFHIRNWASNSTAVINHLKDEPLHEQLPKDLATAEKVLGMFWDPNKDTFIYIFRFARLRHDVFQDSIIPTKRELLQVLMSIFDPLGFLSCYTTALKILLQEVWRSDIGWDTQLLDAQNTKWKKWKVLLEQISTLQIPRCYSPYLNESCEVELHTFVDAGEDAYAAVCYLRIMYHENCSVALIAGKSKVAPLRPISIPRLELQAAVVGVRLAKKIAKNQRLKITSRIFWSDSKTVLQWLRIDPRRFQQFVMHRVGEIPEETNVDQWRWVPSKENPADLATKVQVRRDTSMWFNGPEFLHKDKLEWPVCSNFEVCGNDEMRHHILLVRKTKKSVPINYNYFSNWRRLYRAVAGFLLYMRKLKAKCDKKPIPDEISYEMTQKAKSILFRCAQESAFAEEICCLKRGKSIENRSKLIGFNVFMDDESVLRVNGRASHLNHQNPVILPTTHHVTTLLVRYTHEGYHHISHETVINTIKAQYYIPKLRVLYKTIRRSCQYCKNASAEPSVPQMSTVPPARLASFERPFTFVGIDYFGPLYVNVGRRKEKRWGVLFTCLTVRALHIEIAHSLDTSSCVMCLNNFIARRGSPREIFTDNGTNFKATAKIFAYESKELNLNEMTKKFDFIKWNFNPPAAPHMGGAWERLVRSVKTTIHVICPNMNFNDETLRSAMAEAEFIINSRPLTFVSLDSCDDEALTPNHLLLGSSTGCKPLVHPEIDLRLRCRLTQEFVKQFWRRWIKEYTPSLTKRSKWFEKTTPLKVGDVVIVVDENQPRRCWPKGRVIDTIIAKDGQVRQATVKTQFGVLQRPSTKIAKLEVGNTNE